MRTRIVLVVAALILGGIAAIMAATYLNSARSQIDEASEPVQVLVAQQDIPRGTPAEDLFKNKLVVLEEVPAQFVASGAISSQRAIEGQVLAIPLTTGEQLTAGRFQYPSAAGLAYTVPEDYVAISIPADAVSGVAGLLRPGDQVAVLVTLQEAEDRKEAVTKTIVSKARVLAIDDNTGVETQSTEEDQQSQGLGSNQAADDSYVPKTVTLAVSSAEAQELVLAENLGEGTANRRLWLVLLPARGTGVKVNDGVSLDQLMRTGSR